MDKRTDLSHSRSLRSVRDTIGDGLRRLFEDVAKEPVPDEFLDLLRQIDAQRGVKP